MDEVLHQFAIQCGISLDQTGQFKDHMLPHDAVLPAGTKQGKQHIVG
jgi:hypothetical protein